MAGGELLERVQRLTAQLERVKDPAARDIAEELMVALLEMHGAGLERMLEALDDDARRRIADDGLVGSLLLIHDLYPVPIEERVQQGLDEVRPYMESHGGNVELLAVEEGVAKLRLTGSCDGCAASSSTLELAVEKALEETAPDLLGMEVEGAVPSSVTGTALPMAGNGVPSGMGDWIAMDGLDGMAPGELRAVEATGKRLLVANVDGDLLAYLDSCADCGGSLAGAALAEGVLACPSCTRRYYLPRAGRSLDDDRLQLGPVPLLSDAEGPRVALPA